MRKRVFDIVLSALGLLVCLPVLAAIAAAVLISEGPPFLFRQVRVGRSGGEFLLFKFRTMTVRGGGEKGSFDMGSTARVTKLGRRLRRAKLDELPQLWNVLRGDMSLVGPRPEVRRWVGEHPSRWEKVLSVRPGLTDPASIEYRNEGALLAASPDPETAYRDEILPRKLDLYERYVREQSLLGDIRILWRTAWVLLKR